MTTSNGERLLPGDRSYRYDLNADQLSDYAARLLSDYPPTSEDHYVCYRLTDDWAEDMARSVERTVFEEAFGNDIDTMQQLYGPYEEASQFFLSVDTKLKQPTGALRVIRNSPAGLMTLNELGPDITPLSQQDIMAYHGIESLDDCWDVGTVAVLPEYRKNGGGISIQLYRALYVSAMQSQIEHMVSIIDKKPYKTMKRYLGIPFEPLAGIRPFSYEGSGKSIATYGHIPDFYPTMSRYKQTLRGHLAKASLHPLVDGTRDGAIQFNTTYNK